MRRVRVMVQAGIFACLLSVIGSDLFAANPVDAVPASASAAIRWKAPEASWDKLTAFANGVHAQFGAVVENSRPPLEPLLGLEEAGVIDMSQDVWAIVFAESQVEPQAVLVFTASDLDTLQKEIPEEHLFISEKLVAYSNDKGSLTEVQRRLEKEGTSLWESIDPASKAAFDAGDFSFVINVTQLTEEFKDELSQAEPMLNAFVDQVTSAVPEAQQAQTAAIFDVYKQLGKSILAGIQDTKSYVGALTVTKTTVTYDDRLQVDEGTPTATMFAGFTPGPLSLVNSLPAGKAFYVGTTKLDMAGFATWGMKLTRTMMEKDNEDKLADFDKMIEELGKLKFGDLAMYVDFTGAAPILQTGSVMGVNPGKRMREMSEKMIESISSIKMGPMTQTSKLEKGIAKIGKDEVDQITVTQEFSDDSPEAEAQKKMQKTLFGEAMKSYTIYQDARVVQTMGGDIDNLKVLMKGLDSKEAGGTWTKARKGLPKNANLIALVDLAHVITGVAGAIVEQAGLPVDTDALKELKFDDTYLGYSFSCEPTAAKSHLEIPVEQVNNIVKVVMTLMPRR